MIHNGPGGPRHAFATSQSVQTVLFFFDTRSLGGIVVVVVIIVRLGILLPQSDGGPPYPGHILSYQIGIKSQFQCPEFWPQR